MTASISNFVTTRLASGQELDEYENFKGVLDRADQELEDLISYLKGRRVLEETYTRELEKLGQKYRDVSKVTAARNGYTLSQALRELNNVTFKSADAHRTSNSTAGELYDKLSTLLDTQRKNMKEIRAELKAHFRDFTEMRDSAVPKLKRMYNTRHEEALALKTKLAADMSNQKLVAASQKVNTEASNAEHGYRRGIELLEEKRLALNSTIEWARTNVEGILKARIEAVKTALVQFTKTEQDMQEKEGKTWSEFNVYVECIKHEVDVEQWSSELKRAFPLPKQTHYEHVDVGASKDLIFGMSLRRHFELKGRPVPYVVDKLFEIVERRGIESEGIYRLSSRVSDVESLRVQLEKDETTVSQLFEDGSCDVNAVAGLIKFWLRELPEPLVLFPCNERVEVARTDDASRISYVRAKLQQQPGVHIVVLKHVLRHLLRVASRAEKNKMGTRNLAKIFSTLLFGGGGQIKKPAAQVTQDAMLEEIAASERIAEELLTNVHLFFEELAPPISVGRVSGSTDSESPRTVDNTLASSAPIHSNAASLAIAAPISDSHDKTGSTASTSASVASSYAPGGGGLLANGGGAGGFRFSINLPTVPTNEGFDWGPLNDISEASTPNNTEFVTLGHHLQAESNGAAAPPLPKLAVTRNFNSSSLSATGNDDVKAEAAAADAAAVNTGESVSMGGPRAPAEDAKGLQHLQTQLVLEDESGSDDDADSDLARRATLLTKTPTVDTVRMQLHTTRERLGSPLRSASTDFRDAYVLAEKALEADTLHADAGIPRSLSGGETGGNAEAEKDAQTFAPVGDNTAAPEPTV